MKQEDKDLFLKDICARLPYWVKVSHNGVVYDAIGYAHDKIELCKPFSSITQWVNIDEIKPYLRPLSSMTEEEDAEMTGIVAMDYDYLDGNQSSVVMLNDWYHSKHFDVRGLIPKAIAIEVTEENNPYGK